MLLLYLLKLGELLIVYIIAVVVFPFCCFLFVCLFFNPKGTICALLASGHIVYFLFCFSTILLFG